VEVRKSSSKKHSEGGGGGLQNVEAHKQRPKGEGKSFRLVWEEKMEEHIASFEEKSQGSSGEKGKKGKGAT